MKNVDELFVGWIKEYNPEIQGKNPRCALAKL